MEDKLVTFATERFARAQVLKARLESEGIQCIVSNLNLIQSTVSDGVRIKVNESDVQKAIQVYLSIKRDFSRDGRSRVRRSRTKGSILVPIDFSESSFNAACFAIHLAHVYKTEVNLFHVFYVPAVDLINSPDVNFSYFGYDAVLQDLQKKAKKQMNIFTRRIKLFMHENDIREVKIEKKIVEGLAAEMILAESKSYKADYVVIGTLGRNSKKRKIFGSNVWRVIQQSNLPVIAVPENYQFLPAQKTYNVMFATDLDDAAFVALRKLLQILKPFEALKLHCVHVSSKPVNNFQKAQMKELKNYINHISAHEITVDLIEAADYMKAFESYIKKQKIDLICMSTQRRNIIERFFSPSLAKKMLYHTETPLLLVHI